MATTTAGAPAALTGCHDPAPRAGRREPSLWPAGARVFPFP